MAPMKSTGPSLYYRGFKVAILFYGNLENIKRKLEILLQ